MVFLTVTHSRFVSDFSQMFPWTSLHLPDIVLESLKFRKQHQEVEDLEAAWSAQKALQAFETDTSKGVGERNKTD